MKNILLLILPILFVAPVFLFSRGATNYERRIKCENYCTSRYWRCNTSARKKKGRYRDKSLGICGTFFADCMNKCQRFSD